MTALPDVQPIRISAAVLAARDRLRQAHTAEDYRKHTDVCRDLIKARESENDINTMEAALELGLEAIQDGQPAASEWLLATAADMIEEELG